VRRVSPLPPHDLLRVRASVAHPDGQTYEVAVDGPLVDHPAGRHGTWSGVGIDVWHHGDSGIGAEQLPATLSEVAAFGRAEVSTAGRTIAHGVPIHLMTGHGDDEEPLELHVGEPATPVPSLPDGHLRVVWPAFSGGADDEVHWARYASGSTVLALLLILALAANLSPARRGV